jgi:hypothetical protein
VCADIGGDTQQINQLDTRYSSITFKHLLLPVWISAYRYNDAVYRVLVNARTGEVQGEWPKSWVKIALLVILALISAGAVWFLVQSQGGGGTCVEWSSLAPGGSSELWASLPYPARPLFT